MPTRLIQQHDKFAKQILDQPGNADAFLRERLPAAIVARLAARPAIDRSESHLDKVSRELRGDRVFSFETTAGSEILVWAMIEHKSKPEPDVLKQMLTDLAGIAAKGARERVGPGGQIWVVPAPVYAVLLYHGQPEWHLPRALADAYDLPEEMSVLGFLNFVYTLVNLIEIADEDLSAYPPLQAALLVLKYALHDGDPAVVTLERVLEVAAALGLNVIYLVVRYLAKESAWIDQTRVRRILARLLPGEEDKIMSPFVREIIAEERPKIIAEERPKIIDEGRAEALLSLLRRKFGVDVTDEIVQRVRAANGSQLEQMLNGILDANRIEDVLTSTRLQ